MTAPEVEDLGLKIGTPRQAYLEKLRKAVDEERQHCQFTSEVNTLFLEVLDRQIKEEQEKLK